jgi:hypothetical protein
MTAGTGDRRHELPICHTNGVRSNGGDTRERENEKCLHSRMNVSGAGLLEAHGFGKGKRLDEFSM